MSKQMKTTAQNRAIFGLGAKLGCGKEELRELAYDVTGGRTDALSKLTFDEANGMIQRLGGRPFTKTFNSRRTENYHRQKAGVETIVTTEHLEKLSKLWFAKPHRTAEGLEALCQRINKTPKPRTAKECSRVIEAIKSMNKRDQTFSAFKKDDKEAA
ncbi:MAG: hypothetical protein JSS81_05965 [Acidobacteria bacterium]|nr:hypothetical protein [Acidobacteriota bacterium]